MTPRRPIAATLLAAVLAATPALLAPPAARAADEVVDVDAKTLKSAQDAFAREFDTADIDYKLRALRSYSKVVHPKVAKDLMKLLDDADRNVVAAAAAGLGLQLTSAKSAGPRLQKLIEEHEADEEQAKVVQAAVRSIGALEHRKAEKDLKGLVTHGDDGIVAATFEVFGRWKSDFALREMLDFFKRYPDEKSFATGTVSVDTGAEGSADAEAAKAKWKSKYGGQRGWRPRPECTKALIAALKEITGYGFRRPEDLEDYLKDPKKYVDPVSIGERMSEDDRKAVYVAWCKALEEATAEAARKVPGDAAGDERAKVYRARLNELRGEILEKHRLRLSELDVIVEQGEAAKWPKG